MHEQHREIETADFALGVNRSSGSQSTGIIGSKRPISAIVVNAVGGPDSATALAGS
jgi:hypothetical protein